MGTQIGGDLAHSGSNMGGFFLYLLNGILAVVVGVIMIGKIPAGSALILTLLVMFGRVARVAPDHYRSLGFSSWEWRLFNGVVTCLWAFCFGAMVLCALGDRNVYRHRPHCLAGFRPRDAGPDNGTQPAAPDCLRSAPPIYPPVAQNRFGNRAGLSGRASRARHHLPAIPCPPLSPHRQAPVPLHFMIHLGAVGQTELTILFLRFSTRPGDDDPPTPPRSKARIRLRVTINLADGFLAGRMSPRPRAVMVL